MYISARTLQHARQTTRTVRNANALPILRLSRAIANCRRSVRLCATVEPPNDASAEQEAEQLPYIQVDDFEGLLAEEDGQVPGGYLEALNGNTKLGKAVRAACDELEHLGNLEAEMLEQCGDLLKKLGIKQPLVVKQDETKE